MKKLFTFVLIFGLGVISYALIQNFWNPKDNMPAGTEVVATSTVTSEDEETANEEQPVLEDSVSIAPDGTLLDGPFILLDEQGEDSGATVQIIRSPEETLLQFEDLQAEHSVDSNVYFADNKNADTYIDLGPARMNDGVLVYGVPLDAALDSYSYILIFDMRREKAEYYARVR